MFLVALVSLLAAVRAQNTSCANSSWSIFYIGKSGQFRFENSETNARVQVKIDSLAEYEGYTEEDGLGKRTNNKLNSVAAQDFTWDSSTGEASTFKGVPAITNTLHSTLDIKGNDVPFSMTTVMFCTDGEIQIFNDTEEVGKDTIKFSVEIDNWDFLDAANVLGFGVTVKTKGDENDEEEYEEGETGGSYDFGDGWRMVIPDKALADGDEVDVDVVFGKGAGESGEGSSGEGSSGEGEGESSQSFVFVFPSYEETLDYDPLMQGDKAGKKKNNDDGDDDDEDSAAAASLLVGTVATALVWLRG